MILNDTLTIKLLSIFKDENDFKTEEEILKELETELDADNIKWFFLNFNQTSFLLPKHEGYPRPVARTLYSISRLGKQHLEYLLRLKEDQKREKQITKDTLKWAKIAGLAAVAGVVVTIVSLFKDCNSQRKNILYIDSPIINKDCKQVAMDSINIASSLSLSFHE